MEEKLLKCRMYKEGDYDIAGFAVGIVDKDKIINGKDIKRVVTSL